MINLLKRHPLRTKLVLLYALLLSLSVVLVSYYSYWNIWQILINNKASHLRAGAKPIIEHWLKGHGLTDPDSFEPRFTQKTALSLAHDLTSRDTVAVILNRRSEIIADGKRLPEEPAAPPTDLRYFQKAMSGMNEITYLNKNNGKPVLVCLIPIRTQPGSRTVFGVIQISSRLSNINKILFRHASGQITAVAIILVLGVLFGYWLIGISLKELQDLSATCVEIAKGDFTLRTDVKNRKDEVGRLADSFNFMIDKLEQLFKSQKRFVANTAHELLTPLTGLRGSLEVLLRGAQDDPEAANRLSKGMYREVNHLIRLCDHLLGLSRLDNTSNICKRRIVLSDVMEEVGRKAGHLTKNHSITVKKGPFIRLTADPDLLEQILFNLLSNAIRYSTRETAITLGWKLIPDHVEIWVSDKGEGMNRETLSHVFEPFYRGNNQKSSSEKGCGLGLALTRAMVKVHGGSIRIESSPDKGTTVSFTLPL